MNKLFSICFLITISFSGYSYNIPAKLSLNNGMEFDGIIKKINDCSCQFKLNKEKYSIPLSDVSDISVYSEKYKNKIANLLSNQDNCLNGQTDADLHHGKGGAHFALGFFTGVIGIIGVAAIAKPDPYNGANTLALSKNKDDFNDPTYLSCYKKKAKGKLVGSTAIGLAGWIGLLLLL